MVVHTDDYSAVPEAKLRLPPTEQQRFLEWSRGWGDSLLLPARRQEGSGLAGRHPRTSGRVAARQGDLLADKITQR